MNDTVEVMIPVDAVTAEALASPTQRIAAGRLLAELLKGKHLPDFISELITDIKREARANNLTDEDIDAELDTWRSESHR